MSNTDSSASARVRAIKGRAIIASHSRDVATPPSHSADRSGAAYVNMAYGKDCCGPPVPVDPQGIPRITDVSDGDGEITVYFVLDPPTRSLERAVATYTVTATGGGLTFTDSGPASPITVGGLTNGVAYTVTVTYVTSAGVTTESESESGKPATYPSVIRDLSIIPLDGGARIWFVSPLSDGGATLTGYEYSTGDDVWASIGLVNSPYDITGLSNGTTCTVSLRGLNRMGPGPAAAVSVTPLSSSFTPANIPGINVWLNGQDSTAVTLSDGVVTTWKDRSGRANAFTKTGGLIQYALPSSINSRPAIQFVDAPGTYLSKTFNIAPTNNLTLFMVVRQNVRIPSGNSELFFTRNNYQYFDLFSNGSVLTPIVRPLSLNIGNDTQYSTGQQILDPSRNVLICVTASQPSNFNNRANIYVNGIRTNTDIERTTLSLSNNTLQWAISGGAFKGDIGEVITYPSVLSSTDRQKVEGYLAWKWGLQADLSGGNPYISGPPTSTFTAPEITDITGGNQSLTVTFTGSAGATVTNYRYSTDGGETYRDLSPVDTDSPLTITTTSANNSTLVNDTTYSVILKGISAGEVSAASNTFDRAPFSSTPQPISISPFSGGGNSYNFNENPKFLMLSGSADWAFGTGPYTIEWFQYQTDTRSFPRVFSIGAYATSNISVACSLEGGGVYAWRVGRSYITGTVISPQRNTWNHFAIVRDSSNTTRVYQNGYMIASGADSSNITDSSTPLYIGVENGGADPDTQFGGYITNFRIVKGTAVYSGTAVSPTRNFTVPDSILTSAPGENPYGGSNTAAIPAGHTKLLLTG